MNHWEQPIKNVIYKLQFHIFTLHQSQKLTTCSLIVSKKWKSNCETWIMRWNKTKKLSWVPKEVQCKDMTKFKRHPEKPWVRRRSNETNKGGSENTKYHIGHVLDASKGLGLSLIFYFEFGKCMLLLVNKSR